MALVTGGRIKIGFQTALMLLRAGARVVVTTRFPRDAARRYAREPDFAAFSERLEIHGQHPWGLFFKDYRPTEW